MRKMNRLKATAVAAMLAGLSLAAQADLARMGPLNVPSPPGNGFPLWYQDLNGLALDLCLPNASDPGALQRNACLLTTAAPYTFPAAFPDESFYFRAVATLDLLGGQRAVLVLAHEAAFASATGAPEAGQQVVFTRIRVRVPVPEPGRYFITHPYGTEPAQEVSAVSGGNDINFTEDIGVVAGVFDGSMRSRVGPYLRAADANGSALAPVTLNGAQFLSDGVTPTAVTGSPFGTNFFMICGEREDGTPIQVGTTGPNGQCAVTELFTLTGRLHDMVASPIGTPLAVLASTYSRDAAGTHINVNAQVTPALANAPVPRLTAASMHTPPVRMVGPDPLGRYFTQGFTDPTGTLPGPLTVTNSGDNPPTSVVAGTRDVVHVISSSYNATAQTLTVIATSSDKGFAGSLPPALSLQGLPTVTSTPGGVAGDPASMTLVATGVPVPPPSVIVESAAGGRDEVALTTNPNIAYEPGSPFAVDDAVSAAAGSAAITIPVLANDLANALAPIDPVTLAVLAPGLTPAIGTVTANPNGTVSFTPGAQVGTATFRYTVGSGAVPGASNVATVTVNVTEPVGGFVPLAANDGPLSMLRNATQVINVLANDSGNGGTLDAASVQIVAGSVTGGTATVNANGTVSFRSGATAGTTFGFNYTVANANGRRSAPARVDVTVVAGETLVFNVRAPECRVSGRRWRADGSGLVPNSTVTWYAPATAPANPSAAQTVQTVTVSATGTFSFDFSGGPACTTRSSFRTSTGTVANNVATRQR